jgi:hypothetical protein
MWYGAVRCCLTKTAGVTDDQLLRFAYNTGTTFGASAPDHWQPDNLDRPYPAHTEMSRGKLMAMQAPCLDR